MQQELAQRSRQASTSPAMHDRNQPGMCLGRGAEAAHRVVKPRVAVTNTPAESAAEAKHQVQDSPAKTVASRYSKYPLVLARTVPPARMA